MFQWQVPADANGWFEVLVLIEASDGGSKLLRYNLLADPLRTGTIEGRAFYDGNANGVKDLGEASLGGWTVELLDAITGEVLLSRVTSGDSEGRYDFRDLTPGDYTLREMVLEEWLQVAPKGGSAQHPVAVPKGGVVQLDFGNRLLGDANGDRLITADDLRAVMLAFGTSPPSNIAADFNGDNVIDIFDLVPVALRL